MTKATTIVLDASANHSDMDFEMKLRWTSLDKRSEGPTALAFLETIVAISLSIAISRWTGSIAHIVVAAFLSPLMFLRSEASLVMGKKLFERYLVSVNVDRTYWGKIFYSFEVYFPMIVRSIFVRAYSTAANLPAGFSQMPRNIYRQIFLVDSLSEVELVPRTGSLRAQMKVLDINVFGVIPVVFTFFLPVFIATALLTVSFGRETDNNILVTWVWMIILTVPFVFSSVFLSFIFYLIPIFFRISVKAGVWLWLPLLFLAVRAPRNDSSTSEAIQEEATSALGRLLRGLAALSLTYFAWRALVFPTSYNSLLASDFEAIVRAFVLPEGTEPRDLHPWHIASATNAAMTLGMYFFVLDRQARRLHAGHIAQPFAMKSYRAFYWARGIISIYTVACSFYFGLRLLATLEFAGIDWSRTFPWL